MLKRQIAFLVIFSGQISALLNSRGLVPRFQGLARSNIVKSRLQKSSFSQIGKLTRNFSSIGCMDATDDEGPKEDSNSATKRSSLSTSVCLFRGLIGEWIFDRKLTSRLESAPSGNVKGTATFSIMDYSVEMDLPDLLYTETGIFETKKGFSFEVSSKYVYSYNRIADSIDVYFPGASTTTSESSTVVTRGDMFVSLNCDNNDNGWISASACHFCKPDDYIATFKFKTDGERLEEFEILYKVSGPSKDYDSLTSFRRS